MASRCIILAVHSGLRNSSILKIFDNFETSKIAKIEKSQKSKINFEIIQNELKQQFRATGGHLQQFWKQLIAYLLYPN